MATVFLESGRSTWSAKVRAWDAAAGAWKWRKVSTGLTERRAAQVVADRLEGASSEAKAGTMSRAKAEGLVSTILHLAGLTWAAPVVTLAGFGGDFMEARSGNVGGSTARKYAAHWKRLAKWAGERMEWPLERWTGEICTAYYKDLRAEFSDTTANDHLRTLAMVFIRAEAAGHVRGNPVALVEKAGNDSVEKQVITRGETAALLKSIHGSQSDSRRSWLCLVLLGWHTGHRLQDLLSLTAESVKRSGKLWTVGFRPAKKKRKKEARGVVLPVPAYLAKMLRRLGDLKALHGADNRQGRVSDDFIEWLRTAGIDPLPVERGKRTVHLKSFHSFRHAMSSRLTAAGVSGELARLVTDHDSKKSQAIYNHAEIVSLAGALKKARRI